MFHHKKLLIHAKKSKFLKPNTKIEDTAKFKAFKKQNLNQIKSLLNSGTDANIYDNIQFTLWTKIKSQQQ